jgi:acyl-CoA synthetase (AMP-forming)/AMP-acid ligase II
LGAPTTRDRLLVHMHLYHIFGTLIVYYGLYNGACVVLQTKYDRKEVVNNVHKYNVHMFSLTLTL